MSTEFAHQDELMKGGEYHPLSGMLSFSDHFQSHGQCLGDLGFVQNVFFYFCTIKNHHLGEYFLLFPSILSRSMVNW